MVKSENKYYYYCFECGKKYPQNEDLYLCPSCSSKNNTDTPPYGVLKIIYDYEKIKQKIKGFNSLKRNSYIDLLPIKSKKSTGYLRTGNTPVYQLYKIDNQKLAFQLFFKDDSQNPTFSFKDRASIIVSAYAKEKNKQIIVTASTGNAGSSLAGICAAQNQKAIILVPSSAPLAKLTQIVMYGAVIIPVKGNYDTAFDLSIGLSEKYGWYNRNTAYNPFTIEGKKTAAFELFDYFNKSIPDTIFVPVGDGVILSGIYKGFEDLLNIGYIEKMPLIVAVQSDKSNNLVSNLFNTNFKFNKSTTIADSISVDIPRNFYMAKNFISKYRGKYVTVSDNEIINASVVLSRNTGIFSEPAAAAAFAGLLKLNKSGEIAEKSKNVVLLTGSGLKDTKSVSDLLNLPEPVEPDLKAIENFLNGKVL